MNIFTNRAKIGTMNVMFQNGGADGVRLPYPMGPSRDSHNGTVDDSPKRPSKLSGITRKAIQKDDSNGGSLPSTPEMHSVERLDVTGRPAEDEAAFDSDTRQLIGQLMAVYTGSGRAQWGESRALLTMKRVVGNLMEKHRYAYNGMTKQLSLEDRGHDVSFIGSVARNIFADGVNNWGRIASLVAFGVVVAQYMKDNGRGDCVEQVSQEMSTYLLTDQRDWLLKNNGWEGFVEFFQVSDPESTVRNMLLAVAGVAGLGATLAMFIR